MAEAPKWEPKGADRRLVKLELTEEESNARIRDLVKNTGNAFIPVTLYGIEFLVRPAIPKKTRTKIDETLKLSGSKEVTLTQIEELSYQIGAELCIEPPWNTVAGWQKFDEESGMAIKVIQELATKVMETEVEIQYFRVE